MPSALPFIPQSRELIQKVLVVGTAAYGGDGIFFARHNLPEQN
jgi:hypothetical protein